MAFYLIIKFDFISLASLDLFKNFIQNIDKFYLENKIVFILLFSFVVIIWVLLFSVMSPLILLSGYIFGPIVGTIIITVSHAIAATILFIVVKLFFKKLIEKAITKKLKQFINFLNKNINHYFLFYRILGDFGAPPPFHNLIPIFTKISTKYYFILTLIGMIPTIFVWANFGKTIRYTTELDYLNFSIFSNPNIYISIILLALISVVPLLAKKILFKKK